MAKKKPDVILKEDDVQAILTAVHIQYLKASTANMGGGIPWQPVNRTLEAKYAYDDMAVGLGELYNWLKQKIDPQEVRFREDEGEVR